MTLHRWSRKRSSLHAVVVAPDEVTKFEAELGSAQQIAQLELENSRLRQLVINLLLEREEALPSEKASRE
jgi:hypothetical protein